jgi:hypothetical protein
MVLEANIEVLTALRKYYQGLLSHANFPLRKSCRQNITAFASQLDEKIYDLRMQVSRTKLLTRISADTKALVGS